jgi:hypothetical protein
MGLKFDMHIRCDFMPYNDDINEQHTLIHDIPLSFNLF